MPWLINGENRVKDKPLNWFDVRISEVVWTRKGFMPVKKRTFSLFDFFGLCFSLLGIVLCLEILIKLGSI